MIPSVPPNRIGPSSKIDILKADSRQFVKDHVTHFSYSIPDLATMQFVVIYQCLIVAKCAHA